MQRTTTNTTNHEATGLLKSAAVRHNTPPQIPFHFVAAATDRIKLNAVTPTDAAEQPPAKKQRVMGNLSEASNVVTSIMRDSVHGRGNLTEMGLTHRNEQSAGILPHHMQYNIFSPRPKASNGIVPTSHTLHRVRPSDYNGASTFGRQQRSETRSISGIDATLPTGPLPHGYSAMAAARPLTVVDDQLHWNSMVASLEGITQPNLLTLHHTREEFHLFDLMGTQGIKSMPRSTHNVTSQDVRLALEASQTMTLSNSRNSIRKITASQVGTATPILADMLRAQPGPQPQKNLVSEALQAIVRNGGNTLIDQHTGSSEMTRSPTKLRLPAVMGHSSDNVLMNDHQAYLRQQIEVFAATQDDIDTNTRGRHRRIHVGQVGIRCRHCAHIPAGLRQKGTAYFPATMRGLYQAAQNMSTNHIQCGRCTEMPESVKTKFIELWPTRYRASRAGSRYWEEAAKHLGLVDTENGIAFQPEPGM